MQLEFRLEEVAKITEALKLLKVINQWNASRLHSTFEEKEEAKESVETINQILDNI